MGWYIVINEEMRDLGLTGNDLLVFATIHGFSQLEQGCFHGSAAYLSKVCGVDSRTIRRILKRLTDGGFLKKTDIIKEGVKFCTYQTRVKLSPGRTFCPGGVGHFVQEGGDILSYNNIKGDNVEDKSSTKNRIDVERVSAPTHAGGGSRFIPPTTQEVKDYVNANGYVLCDPETFVSHYESNGWLVGKNKMKDWKASVRYWHSRRVAESRPTPLQIKRATL